MHVHLYIYPSADTLHNVSAYSAYLVAYNQGKSVKIEQLMDYFPFGGTLLMACYEAMLRTFSLLKFDGVRLRVFCSNPQLSYMFNEYIPNNGLYEPDGSLLAHHHLIDAVQQYMHKHQVSFSNDPNSDEYFKRVQKLAQQEAMYECEKAAIRKHCDECTIDTILEQGVDMERVYHPMGSRVYELSKVEADRYFIRMDMISTYGSGQKVLWVERL